MAAPARGNADAIMLAEVAATDAPDAEPRAKAKAKAKAQSVRHQGVLSEIRDARQILKNELKNLRKKAKQD